ncbi:MAG: Rqc2 family fibronectin-binding protein [Christensenellales bacterium]|jgi:predicted ribosome quality control (RQC) complex YloA/Tae2 family protein
MGYTESIGENLPGVCEAFAARQSRYEVKTMAMDGLSLAAVCKELNESVLGARIEKIYQPEKDELLLNLRSGRRLLLSANAAHCRVQLTAVKRSNPAEPPMFCMLMRKHLTNGRIAAVRQAGLDRVLTIDILATDELGEPATYSLIAEIMGKYSNVVLVKEDGTIVDAIRHVTPAISTVRVLMPGVKYEQPPAQNKLNPTELSKEQVFSVLSASSGRLDKAILSAFFGLSPAVAAEIAERAAGDPLLPFSALDEPRKALCASRIAAFFENIAKGAFCPTLVVDDFGDPVSFFAYDTHSVAPQNKRSFETMSAALDEYFSLRERTDRIRQKSANLRRLLQNNIERCQKKLAMQQEILQASDKMEQNRLFGELLTANAYRAERGAKEMTAVNYYDPDQREIIIPLDPSLSAAANAQKYFKKYNKQRAAFEMATGQIAQIQEELDYLEGLLANLENCAEEGDLAEIRQELIREGYVRPEKEKRQKAPASKPFHYVSQDGIDIFVGKNNLQNDRLTLRDSDPEDIWLHTKNIPGSHVIIRSKNPPPTTLKEAAMLAAWYSKAKHSAQVPVDYTPRKYVKKPSGSRPGFVIYTTNKTLYVTPEESVVRGIQRID